jgi:uncharacterized membrane protein YesL
LAELAPVPPAAPRLGGALRGAAIDFYFNSWRLVPANLAWSAVLLAILALTAGLASLALLLLPLLALPTVGIYRLAVLITRGEPVALSDGFSAWRRFGAPALGLGTALLAAGTMFGVNVGLGLTRGDVAGWSLATLAFWGLAVVAMAACVAWPILVDPRRETLSTRARIRLALLLIVAYPVRFAALAVVLGLVVAISTVGFAALLTISVSYVALVAARYVLPAADRLQARLDAPRNDGPSGGALVRPHRGRGPQVEAPTEATRGGPYHQLIPLHYSRVRVGMNRPPGGG